jgi:hypothetical protein
MTKQASIPLTGQPRRFTAEASPEQPLTRVDDELRLSLWSLYVDKLTCSVTEAFEIRGISSLLLKGPAIAGWLYDDGTARPYGDADLMVSPADWPRAQAALGELGFEKELAALDHPGMGSIASEAWVRGEDNVDLHCTLWGLGVPPEVVWTALSRVTGEIELNGCRLRILAPEARALLVAIHAAKHGDGWAVTDLERAVHRLPRDLWHRAGALAIALDGTQAFAAGMRLVSDGPRLVHDLGLLDAPLPEASLRAWRVPMALGLEQLSRTPGRRAKAAMMFHELFPTPAFMRWWTPLARRGRIGILMAYLWRLLWMARHSVPAVFAWRRARHASSVIREDGFSDH